MPRRKPEGGPHKQTTSEVKKADDRKSADGDDSDFGAKASFPIVGIGASAGGLEAFEQFFTNMPPENGMAFVLVQHLDPTHKSILTDLVKRYTRMKVFEVEDGLTVVPNTVFVIPPNRYMAVLHGKLHLLEPNAPPGLRTPIDYFFRSLAEDRKDGAICIVLSGTGTEGTLGLRAVKGEGGMAMVQEPQSAKYDGMPQSAANTGLADYVLPIDKMPEQLLAYVEQVFGRETAAAAKPLPKKNDILEKVFVILKTHTGHDFSFYKTNIIIRRIERRMAVNRIANMSDYRRHLQEYPSEAYTLFKELLIGVTSFFRDPDAFEILKREIVPKILDNKDRNTPVRVWVPGCATGEEAYSIAILIRERLDALNKECSVQIFATDIDNQAVEAARAGIYPKSIAVDVPSDVLGRSFRQEEGSYVIKKKIRDMVVFAVQNAISDPPFSKTDLISCRNLLIYLNQPVQKKVLSVFHYSLKDGGFLFLGSSETVGELTSHFSVVERKWKFFKREDSGFPTRRILEFQGHDLPHPLSVSPGATNAGTGLKTGYREVTERILLNTYGPAAVIVNEKGEILYVHGRTGKYLEIISGEFSGNITSMAREGLRLELTTALRQAVGRRQEVCHGNLRVRSNGEDQIINLIVKPITEPPSMKGLFMVIFEDLPKEKIPGRKKRKSGAVEEEKSPRVQELEQELKSTKEYLQSTNEELETSNEEMKSTNEELQSSNEELQSTNEELETSKEELQSVNEELITVNSELEQKINELSKTSSDMLNLLASTEIGTIFLDSDLNIKRFTPTMTSFINLMETDIGRPVAHFVSNMDDDRLPEDARQVLKTLIPKESEVRTKDNRWYARRILPYRTVDNLIDGVVITFTNITSLKLNEIRSKAGLQLAQNVIETVREPLIVLDPDMRVLSANRSFYRCFMAPAKDTVGCLFYELGNRQWDTPALKELLEKLLPEQKTIEDFLVEHDFQGIGRRKMLVNARCVEGEADIAPRILVAIEDVTNQQTQ